MEISHACKVTSTSERINIKMLGNFNRKDEVAFCENDLISGLARAMAKLWNIVEVASLP